MNDCLPKVTHEGIIKIEGLEIKVLTLDNGQRIIPEEDFKKALSFLGITEKEFHLIMTKRI